MPYLGCNLEAGGYQSGKESSAEGAHKGCDIVMQSGLQRTNQHLRGGNTEQASRGRVGAHWWSGSGVGGVSSSAPKSPTTILKEFPQVTMQAEGQGGDI